MPSYLMSNHVHNAGQQSISLILVTYTFARWGYAAKSTHLATRLPSPCLPVGVATSDNLYCAFV